MMDNTEIVKCRNCGRVLNVRSDETVGKRTPCPSCGSTSRAFEVTAKASLGLKVSVSGAHYRWINRDISYVIGSFIINSIFSFIALIIGIVIGGVMGGLIGFVLAIILSFIYIFYLDRQVKVLISRFGEKDK